MSRISTLVFESRLPVGSSASSSGGLLIRARAMATRCMLPAGQLGRVVVHARAEADAVEQVLGPLPPLVVRQAAARRRSAAS